MTQLTLFDLTNAPTRPAAWPGSCSGWPSNGSSSARRRGSTRLARVHLQQGSILDRGKFSQKRFEAECLREYAETFPVVGGDFSFYQFPTPSYWEKLFDETPSRWFGLKVPEEITPKWPGHARYGTRAGKDNQGFLDNHLFHEMFTWPLERYRDRVAVLILEFGTLAKSTFPKPDDFLAQLDPFLGAAPSTSATRSRSATPNTWGPTISRCPRTARRTSSTPGRECPSCSSRSPCRAPSRPISLSSAPCSRRAACTRQAVKAFDALREVQEPNPGAREAMRKIADAPGRTDSLLTSS